MRGPGLPLGSRRTTALWILAGAACCLLPWGGPLPAADAPENLPEIRRIYVPADSPALWPRGYQPISSTDFEALWNGAQPRPQQPESAVIDRALYTAVLEGETLRDGTMDADVRLTGDAETALADLEPLNLAVTRLRWSANGPRDHSDRTGSTPGDAAERAPVAAARPDVDALWGSTGEGRSALLVDRRRGRLKGRWEHKGRRLAHGVEFEVRVAPAAVSELELQIPEAHNLRSTVGDVSGPHPAGRAGWRTWRVRLGHHTSCRLTINPVRAAADVPSQVLYESDVQCMVRQEGVQFQARISAEVFTSPLDQIILDLPASVEIDTVTYGGSGETPLQWTATKRGARQRLAIRFPEPLIGPTRSIRVDGFAPARFEQKWTLPNVILEQGVFLSGQYQLRIDRPLELRSADSGLGFRAASAVSATDDSETFQFRQFVPEAALVVEISRPRLSLAARVVSHLDVQPEAWTVRADVDWQASAGSAFELLCDLPAGWEISEVVPRSEESVVANWAVSAAKDGNRLLSIEFLKAVGPDDPKAVRVIASRVPLPPGEPLTLPMLAPRHCTSVAQWLVVTHPPAVVASLGAESSFQPVAEETLPEELLAAPLWSEVRQKSELRRMVLSAASPAISGAISFESRERAIEARAAVKIDLTAQSIREDLTVDILPAGEPVESVHVFLTSTGAPFTWRLIADSNPVPIAPQRVPALQDDRWDLPAGGELWEFRLPDPQTREFRLAGVRTSPLPASKTAALAFVPGARDFAGRVETTAVVELDVESEPAGMHAVETEALGSAAAEAAAEPRSTHRVWTYRSPRDALNLRIDTPAGSGEERKFAGLLLRSRLSVPGAGNDVHVAQFAIDPDSRPGAFRFTLPANASLLAVRLNGQTVRPTRQRDEFLLPSLPRRRVNSVEVQYRMESSGAWLRDRHNVPLLTSSHEILRFQWELELPAGFQLLNEPDGLLLAEPLPELSWGERLFGPLGRPNDQALFNPLRIDSWKELFSANRPADELVATDEAPLSQPNAPSAGAGELPPANRETAPPAPPERMVWHASSLHLPEPLSVTLWHAARLRLLAWLTVLASLSGGLLVRIVAARRMAARFAGQSFPLRPEPQENGESVNRRRLAAGWIAALVTVAVAGHFVAALMAGSLLAGTLLALLVPRRWFLIMPRASGRGEGVPLGSTASLVRASFPLTLLAFTALAAAAKAQQPAGDAAPSAPAVNRVSADSNRYSILIPVHGAGQPAGNAEQVIYAPPELIARLRRVAAARSASAAEYLITSAEYRGVVDLRQAAAVEARYTIAVVSARRLVRVHLPISNANLDAPNACTVNGRPQPVLPAPNHEGYVIELHRPPAGSSPTADGEEGAEAASPEFAATASGPGPRVELMDVVLRFYPLPAAVVGGNGIRVGIPPVVTSRVSLRFGDGAPPSQVFSGRDRTPMDRDGNVFSTVLGRAAQWEASWFLRPSQARAEVEASVVRFVTVQPTRLEYRYRIGCRVTQGSVEKLACRVPRGAVVRSVGEGLPFELTTPAAPSEPSRLLILLPEPRSQDFTLDFSLLLPMAASNGETRVPLVEPFDDSRNAGDVFKTVLSDVGLSTASEFRLTPVSHESDRLASLAADTPLRKEAAAAGLRDPELAYRIASATELVVRLTPLAPLRKIVQTQQGTLGRQRLDWKLTAEIRTENAPAFGHRLTVDPRLKIESISVQEDGAERLVRWSRDGSLVNLFLRDRTTATQDVVLVGSMPLVMSAETALPVVRVEEGEVTQSRLMLDRAEDVAVEMLGLAGLTAIETADEQRSGARTVLMGQYLIPNGAELPRLRLLPQHERARVETATLVNGPSSVTVALRFQHVERLLPQLRLRIPREIALRYQLIAPQAKTRTENREDGSIEIVVEPLVAGADSLEVIVNAAMSAPGEGAWPLPRIGVPDVAEGENYLLLANQIGLRQIDPGAEPIAVDALPEWIGASLPILTDPADWSAYVSRASALPQSWKVTRDSSDGENPEMRIPLARTRVEHDDLAREWGATDAVVMNAAGRQLTLRIPAGVVPRALFVNGRPVALTGAGEQVPVPLDAGNEPQTVVLYWFRETRGPGWMEQFAPALPEPAAPTERTTLTFVAPKRTWIARLFDRSARDELKLDAVTADGLLETVPANLNNSTVLTSLWPLLEGIRHASLSRVLGPDISLPEPELDVVQRAQEVLARIDGLSAAVARTLKPADLPFAASGTLPGRLAERSAAANRTVLYRAAAGADEPIDALGWGVNASAVRRSAAAVGFLLLAAVGSAVAAPLTPGRSGWLALLGWGVLGIGWWGLLQPSVVGLAILAAVVVSALRRRPAQPVLQQDSFELNL